MTERKRLTKSQREEIYRKFDGHCAYCGQLIDYSDMQVDHVVPVHAWNEQERGTDEMDNLFPSCRSCNHYKRAHSVETFRQMISEIPSKLARDSYIYKIGMNYQFYDSRPKAISFYFEMFDLYKLRDKCNEINKLNHGFMCWLELLDGHFFLYKLVDVPGGNEVSSWEFLNTEVDEAMKMVNEWVVENK